MAMAETSTSRLAALERENASLRSRVAQLERENASLRSNAAGMESKVGQLELEINEMKNGAIPEPLPPGCWASAVEFLPMDDILECCLVCRAFLNTIVPSADLATRSVTLDLPCERNEAPVDLQCDSGVIHYKASRFRGVRGLRLKKGYIRYSDAGRNPYKQKITPIVRDELRSTLEALGRPNSVKWLEIWDVGHVLQENGEYAEIGTLGPEGGQALVPYLENVEELILHLNHADLNEITQFAAQLQRLKKVSLYVWAGDVKDLAALYKLKTLPNLSELRIHGPLHYHSETEIGRVLSELTGLRRLDTNMLANKHSDCCEILSSLRNLHTLMIRCPPPEFWPILATEGGCQNVKKLIVGCGMNPSGDGHSWYIVDMGHVRAMVSGLMRAFPCLEIIGLYIFCFGSYRGDVEWDAENLAENLSGLGEHSTLREIHLSCEYCGFPERKRETKGKMIACREKIRSQLDNTVVLTQYVDERDTAILYK